MQRMFAKPNWLAISLLFLTAVPIIVALMRLIQVPSGTVPESGQHLTDTPVSLYLHALGGAAFGIIGPLQFAGVLKRRFGKLHKVLGYIFVVAGLFLGTSALTLLLTHLGSATVILNGARALAGAVLVFALIRSVLAAIKREIFVHRAWMIRAYAVGMGSATVVFLFVPYMLITGSPATGLTSDLIFVLSWAVNIGIAEWIIRRPKRARRMPRSAAQPA